MSLRIVMTLSCGIMLAPTWSQEFGLTGTVSNKTDARGLEGVKVELVAAKLIATTDSLGRYRLGNATSIGEGRSDGFSLPGHRLDVLLRGQTLWLQSREACDFSISFSDLRGRSLASAISGNTGAVGIEVGLPAGLSRSDVILVRVASQAGDDVFHLLPADGRGSLVKQGSGRGAVGPRAKSAAALDTLRVKRTGYKTVDVPIESRTGIHDVTLEAEVFGCASGAICWDFEEGALPAGWTAYRNEFTGTLLVDGTKPHKGTFALHAKDLSGGKEGAQGGPKKSIKFSLPANFGPVLWGRAFVYTTPARPESHAGLFNARYPRPGSVSTAVNTLNWYELATYQQRYMGIWHPPEPPGFPEWVMQSDKPLVLDAWTCLEWVFDGANGTAPEAADPRVWVDGAELSWPTKFTFSDPAGKPRPVQEKAQNFTFLETGVYLYQGLTQVTNWWIDDLAVGPRRVGCQ